MAREPIPTWFFVVVVVRRGARFLLVHETKHGQLWYFPAGAVEPGETFIAAAERETLEEGGIPIEVEGVVRIEHSPMGASARCRVILVARPKGDTPPKTEPDSESLEAGWFALDELDALPLRGAEVRGILEYVAGGGRVYPLDVITAEGAPLRRV